MLQNDVIYKTHKRIARRRSGQKSRTRGILRSGPGFDTGELRHRHPLLDLVPTPALNCSQLVIDEIVEGLVIESTITM